MNKYRFLFILCYLNIFSLAAADKADDLFQDPSQWSIDSTASVHISRVDPVDSNNHALCFNYSADNEGGNVVLYRRVKQNFPADFQLQLTVRNQDEIDSLQIVLNDSYLSHSWFSKPLRLIPSSAAQALSFSSSQLITYSFDENFTPVRLNKANELYIKFHVPPSESHSFCFDGLAINPVSSRPSISSFHPSVTVDTAPALQQHIIDGNQATYWLSGSVRHQTIALDLGSPLPVGGVILDWVPGLQATAYSIRSSIDDRHWSLIHHVTAGLNSSQWIALPETQARYLRFDLEEGPNWRYGLKEIRLQPLIFSKTPNDFIRNYARNFPLGNFPPFLSQQTNSLIPVGVDGGSDFAVMSDFGAIELARDGITVEPMIVVDNKKIYNWANVHADQHLQDDYLPIPTVQWTSPYFSSSITAFNHDKDQEISTLVRYNIKNTTKNPHTYRFALAVRPFRASQKFNVFDDSGGLTPIKQLSILGRAVHVNGHLSFSVERQPDISVLTPFDSGMDFDHLFDITSRSSQVDDASGLASGLLIYTYVLKPGESQSLFFTAPLIGNPEVPDNLDVDAALAKAEKKWSRALNIFRVELPGESKPLFDSFRTAFAHELMCRDWQNALNQSQTYTRCHLTNAHSVVDSLLRLGRFESARELFNASISNQLKNRLLSCCQPSQASFQAQIFNQGAWFHSLSEYARYSHDRSFSLAMWPHLIQWFDSLPDPLSLKSREQIQVPSSSLFGIFPSFDVNESMDSQAKTMSWQNLWTLSALTDGIRLAKSLQKDKEIPRLNAYRDALVRSLFSTPDNQPSMQYDPFGYLDHDRLIFNASTDLLPHLFLPERLLAFEQHDWDTVEKQLSGESPDASVFLNQWQTVATMLRSRSRDRAWKLSEMMLNLRRPMGWNQWPVYMDSTHSKRVFYSDLLDLSSSADLINAALDFFVYDKPSEQALVLADGIPKVWFTNTVPIILEGIHTPYGLLNFQITHPDSNHTRVLIEEGTGLPPGGFIFHSPFLSSSNVSVNQQPYQWDSDQAIVIHSVPATIDIALPPSQ